MHQPPRIAIVGAGFGGLSAARALAHAPVHVIMVERNNFHTFQPLLYQVATAGLDGEDVAYAVRGVFHDQINVSFKMAQVEGVDLDHRELICGEGGRFGYDFLVLAAGAATSYFGVPGAEQHSFALKTLEDAIRLRSHVLRQFELADGDAIGPERGELCFVVIGGGPTGVEVVGALTELFRHVLAKDFRSLAALGAKVVLIEMADHLLTPFAERLRAYALDQLRRMGVDVRLETAVDRVERGKVHLTSGEVIATETVIWTAGVKASPLGGAMGIETAAAGRVAVGPDLSLPGHPEVFVIGDLAAVAGRRGQVLPQLAPVAIQQGRHAARQIERLVSGRETKAFHYLNKGTMATIGRNAAVSELPGGVTVVGFAAWVSWLSLHLVFLVGFRNRMNVLLNWAWSYVTYDRGSRLILPIGEPAPPPPGDRPEAPGGGPG
ncbi:MAG: NAD(P)/FAD-dependent oxidoreductase [Acidimicrobiales bacterium]